MALSTKYSFLRSTVTQKWQNRYVYAFVLWASGRSEFLWASFKTSNNRRFIMEMLIDRYYSAGHKYNTISFYITSFIETITKCFTVSTVNRKLWQGEGENLKVVFS